MPLFKFLRHGDLKENFRSTGRRDLNIKYTNFDFKMFMNDDMNACDEIMNVCNATTYAKT